MAGGRRVTIDGVTFAQPAPPPGWYPDPSTPGIVRWWSGREWTEHTAPAAQQAELPYSLDDRKGFTAMNLVVPSGRSVATRSLVWGIVSVLIPVLLISVLAIVFGAIGLNRAHVRARSGYDADGRGRALAGVILGCVSLIEPFVLVGLLRSLGG
jgi:hypothetical protein